MESTHQSPQSPHRLKALGRRVSHSKPLRMLKTFASKTSLRGHAHRLSASSVHSAHSEEVDAHARDASETYGKEVAAEAAQVPQVDASPPMSPGPQPQAEMGGEEHEAEARQVSENSESMQVAQLENEAEPEPRIVQTKAAEALHEPVVEPFPGVTGAVEVEDQEDHVEETRNEDPQASRVSLSSSSTIDTPALIPLSAPDGDKLKLFKMDPLSSPPVQTVDAHSPPEGDASAADHAADINPFIVDDPEDPLSEPESELKQESANVTSSPVKSETPLAESVVLSTQVDSAVPPPAPSLHDTLADLHLVPVVDNKTAESTPASLPLAASDESSSSTSEEDEAPELHTPALTVATLFLPVPNTDPLTALLIKHVPEPHLRPPRDVSGEWQHTDLHTLVMTNNWRALARMARDRIVTSNPSDVELILNLWYIRLSSLARLRLFNQTSAECENLFSVLATIEPPATRAYVFDIVLPFELEVLRARCAYWAGDHTGYLDDMSALLRRCRMKARRARDAAEREMWRERGARMTLIVASQLVESKDYTAATALLEPLCAHGAPSPSPALRSAIGRIYLQGGFIAAATTHFDAVDADPEAEKALKNMNAVVRAAAEGDWQTAAAHARALIESESDSVVAVNNYAVALLGLGKVKEGIQILESTLRESPSVTTTAEPYLFNLSTMYELHSALTAHKKHELLVEVAKWSGDGLRTACLKMN